MEERRVERRTAAHAVLETALDTDDVEELRRIVRALEAVKTAGKDTLCAMAVLAATHDGADVNTWRAEGAGEVPLLVVVAEGGHVELTEALLEAGAEVDQASNEGETALIGAAVNGHVEAVLALLEAGAEVGHVDNEGETAQIGAAGNGHCGCPTGVGAFWRPPQPRRPQGSHAPGSRSSQSSRGGGAGPRASGRH
jgi:hypothetical protein